MKFKELKALAPTELEERLVELRMELMKENAQVAIGTTPKSPGKIKQNKKDIARIKMLLHMKENTKEVKTK